MLQDFCVWACTNTKRHPLPISAIIATSFFSQRQSIPAAILFTALSSVATPVPPTAPFRATAHTALAYARQWLASPSSHDSHSSKMQSYKILFRFCAMDGAWKEAVDLCDDVLRQWSARTPRVDQDWSHLLNFFLNTAETCKVLYRECV